MYSMYASLHVNFIAKVGLLIFLTCMIRSTDTTFTKYLGNLPDAYQLRLQTPETIASVNKPAYLLVLLIGSFYSLCMENDRMTSLGISESPVINITYTYISYIDDYSAQQGTKYT